MKDVPEFIRKSHEIYGYRHFVNDAGGSLCELDDPEVLRSLAEHTLIIYIKTSDKDEQELIRRAEDDPKPLYYREAFLDEQLALYQREKGFEFVAQIDPDDFVRWMFPRLFYSRLPRYQAIAERFGYRGIIGRQGRGGVSAVGGEGVGSGRLVVMPCVTRVASRLATASRGYNRAVGPRRICL